MITLTTDLILEYLFNLAIAFILAMITHEGGHYIAAKFFGETIKFSFKWGMLFNVIPIPRGIWEMPENLTKTQKKIVAGAGFFTEFLCAFIALFVFNWPYLLIVATIHIICYPLYCGEESDFKWFKD